MSMVMVMWMVVVVVDVGWMDGGVSAASVSK